GRVEVLPHRLERLDGAVAGQEQCDRRHRNGQDAGHDRCGQGVEDAGPHAASPAVSWAPVMYEPSSAGVTVAGSRVATTRPPYMTRRVSDKPISSSRSADTRTTASPLRRACFITSHTAAWAPTSMPRVGWEASRTVGSAIISRPTISFCWLPPDRAL